ncbi:MAG: DNA/RNA non-specific endonuclease, partial [Cyanobacteria bacterium J06639_18]
MFGLPPVVNGFYQQGRRLYLQQMDGVLDRIVNIIAIGLANAKAHIANGRKTIQQYLAGLPQNLRALGQQAATDIQTQFDELEQTVDSKKDLLVDTLADKYKQNLQAIDSRIDQLKAANQGLVNKAFSAMTQVISTINNIKQMLLGVLGRANGVIGNILKDPVQFLGNLITGIKQGFQNFAGNIVTHLESGFVSWLTGTMAPMGIQIPDNVFSLPGVFSLVAQVLGLTYSNIRRKAVKRFGERTVLGMESSVEIFQVLRDQGVMGLWEQLQAQFSDLKETVIEEIKNMLVTQVITAGVKWILSLLNPASAFVRAAMAIYDIVMFFVNRGSQVLELVNAVIDAVAAIASGSVGGAAKLVENALARALPVAIGFFASLLGVGGLANRVERIIGRVRHRIDRAIDWILLKAQKAFGKFLSKGKKGFNKLTRKVLKWWKIDKKFKDKAGNKHRLFFEGKGLTAVLMVASTPQPFESFIKSVEVKDEDSRKAKIQALAIAKQIDSRKTDSVKGANDEETKKNEEKKKQDLEELINQLSSHAKVLFGVSEEELPESKINFNSFTRDGAELGDSMTAELLTKKGEKGSVPTTEKHKIFDKLLKRRDGGRSYYIRGHLLNHHIHGPGKWKNLTPLSQSGNKAHLFAAEDTTKAAVQSGAIVRYTVKVIYGRSVSVPTDEELKSKGIDSSKWEDLKDIRSAEKHVPEALNLSTWLLEKQEDGTYKKKQNIVAEQSV